MSVDAELDCPMTCVGRGKAWTNSSLAAVLLLAIGCAGSARSSATADEPESSGERLDEAEACLARCEVENLTTTCADEEGNQWDCPCDCP